MALVIVVYWQYAMKGKVRSPPVALVTATATATASASRGAVV